MRPIKSGNTENLQRTFGQHGYCDDFLGALNTVTLSNSYSVVSYVFHPLAEDIASRDELKCNPQTNTTVTFEVVSAEMSAKIC